MGLNMNVEGKNNRPKLEFTWSQNWIIKQSFLSLCHTEYGRETENKITENQIQGNFQSIECRKFTKDLTLMFKGGIL